MDRKLYAKMAEQYLQKICSVEPNRRTGSPGNKAAVDFCTAALEDIGYAVDKTPFNTFDFKYEKPTLSWGNKHFQVFVSPYSPGCNVTAGLVVVSNLQELHECPSQGKILLMKGELCTQQLTPKNFPFYYHAQHQLIYDILEEKQPAAIITATAKKPETTCALYPFPLFVDGDFDIPSVYCDEDTGKQIAEFRGKPLSLNIPAERIPTVASNVIAVKKGKSAQKIVVCSHIDAYEGSPGAIDNASGCVVLLLLARMLHTLPATPQVEMVFFNGEDHYSAGGQVDYLKRFGHTLKSTALAVNVDGAGYIKGKTAYSFYECSHLCRQAIRAIFSAYQGLAEKEPWYNGDHTLFSQQGVPAVAVTSEHVKEILKTIIHTKNDTPGFISPFKLIEIAEALRDVILNFRTY